jgi:hypothetical protein
MDVLVALLVLIVSLTGAFLILVHWLGQGAKGTVVHYQRRSITRPKQPIEIFEMDGSFVEMPDHLKTHDEMVAWMTRELPDLIAKKV